MLKFFIIFFSFYSFAKYAPLKFLSQSLHIIEENDPKKTDRARIIEGAIKGMLFEMDPYASLMTKKEVKKFNKYKFRSGIGAFFAFNENRSLVVLSVLSKAVKKGLQPGDIITHIQKRSVQEQTFDDIQYQITNKKNSPVHLTIQRIGQRRPLQLTLPITQDRAPSIVGKKITEDVFYIRIHSFKDSTLKEVKDFLQVKPCLKKKSFPLCSQSKKGLVLDLRYNPGGVVDEALLIADLFLSQGILMKIKEKDPQLDQVFRAKQIGTIKPIPIVVIINAYSASSAESLAAALKDNNRALIFGSKSFGKGSIQRIFPVNEKYSIKMTAAHFQTPLGHDIEKVGVTPHIDMSHYPNPKKFNQFKKKFQQNVLMKRKVSSKNSQWIQIEKNDLFIQRATELIFQLSQ